MLAPCLAIDGLGGQWYRWPLATRVAGACRHKCLDGRPPGSSPSIQQIPQGATRDLESRQPRVMFQLGQRRTARSLVQPPHFVVQGPPLRTGRPRCSIRSLNETERRVRDHSDIDVGQLADSTARSQGVSRNSNTRSGNRGSSQPKDAGGWAVWGWCSPPNGLSSGYWKTSSRGMPKTWAIWNAISSDGE